MLDPKLLRNSPKEVDMALKKRGIDLDLSKWKENDNSRKNIQAETEKLQSSLNKVSKEIGNLKRKKLDSSVQEDKASLLTKKIKNLSKKLQTILKDINKLALELPNIPDKDVPEGSSEKDNLEIRSWGKIPEFSFKPKDHLEIGEKLGLSLIHI